MRCAVYVRVSTEMVVQKSSIAHQKNYFQSYIRERGWKLYKIYEDIESGMSVEKRQGLKKLIEDSKKGEFDILLTKSISRFARNTLEGLKYIREFKKSGVRFITIEDAFDSFEYDEFMFTLLLSMAQKESEKISERIKFGKKERAKKGFYNGSNPPYGYKKEGKTGLVPAGDVTTEVVRMVFDMYIQGLGLYKIAKFLNEKGYPTPSMAAKKSNSSNLWHQSTIRNILTNEIYIGNLVQNKSKTKDLLNGIREENLNDEYIRVNNTHEAIVNLNTFRLAQEILKRRSIVKSARGKYLFTDIMYCGECNSKLHHKKGKGVYICGKVNKMGKKYCIGCYLNEKKLRLRIEKDLFRLILDNIDLSGIRNKLREEMGKKESCGDLNFLDYQIEDIVKRKNRLLDIYLEGLITKDKYNLKNISLENEEELLQKKKSRLILELCNNRENIIASYNELYEYVKLDNIVVNKLIKKIIVYNGGRVQVIYNFKPMDRKMGGTLGEIT